MIQGCNIKLLYLEVISLNLKLRCTILLHIPYLICGQINKTLINDIPYMSLYKKQEHIHQHHIIDRRISTQQKKMCTLSYVYNFETGPWELLLVNKHILEDVTNLSS